MVDYDFDDCLLEYLNCFLYSKLYIVSAQRQICPKGQFCTYGHFCRRKKSTIGKKKKN